MRRIVSRATSGMSTYVVVVISPDTTTSPVFTSVSQATRPYGSSRSTASSTPSEIWSAILSGWPSVTDSDVNRNSLSDSCVMGSREGLRGRFASRAGSSAAARRLRLGRGSWHGRRHSLAGGPAGGALTAPLAALVEVDDQRHPVHPEAGAQAVLDEVRVVAGDARARVDGDREARRRGADLGHVQQLEALAAAGRRVALP